MAKSFKDSIKKTGLQQKSGIASLITDTSKKEPQQVEVPAEPKDIRKTFVVDSEQFETFLDYVYMVKSKEDPMYTQKEALREAFDLLFATTKKIPKRPDSARAYEQKRSNSMKGKRG